MRYGLRDSEEEESGLDCTLWFGQQMNQRPADQIPVYGSTGATRLPSSCSTTALPFCCPSALSASILGPPRVFDSVTFVPSVLAHIGVIRIFKSPLM